jgi:hypothetical protein
MSMSCGRADGYPTRAPTTLAWAEYRLGADSVFKHRRETDERVRGEMRFALRMRGARARDAITIGVDGFVGKELVN